MINAMSADIYAEVKIRPTLIFMNNDSNLIFLDHNFNQFCLYEYILTFVCANLGCTIIFGHLFVSKFLRMSHSVMKYFKQEGF